MAPIPDQKPGQGSVVLIGLIAVEIYRDQVVAALAWETASAGRSEGQRVYFMLMTRQLYLSVGHQVENDDDAARGIGYYRFGWVEHRDACPANHIEQSEVILQNFVTVILSKLRSGVRGSHLEVAVRSGETVCRALILILLIWGVRLSSQPLIQTDFLRLKLLLLLL